MNELNKLLVIRIDQLGDVLLTFAVINKIKKKNDALKIDILVKEEFREFLISKKFFNKVIGFQNTFFGKIICLIRLSFLKYDLTVDCVTRSDFFSSLCLLFSNANKKRGFAVGLRKYLINDVVKPPTELLHETEFVKKLIYDYEIETVDVYAERELKRTELIIAISPFASHFVKEWPLEKWDKFIEKLKLIKNCEVHIFGLKKHQKLLEKLSADGVVIHYNLSLTAFYNILKKTSLHITVNNGAMHLAAIAGVPQIILNGPSSLTRWKPLQKNPTVLSSNLDCTQSEEKFGSFERCVENNGDCMNAITVEDVLKAVKKKIKA